MAIQYKYNTPDNITPYGKTGTTVNKVTYIGDTKPTIQQLDAQHVSFKQYIQNNVQCRKFRQSPNLVKWELLLFHILLLGNIYVSFMQFLKETLINLAWAFVTKAFKVSSISLHFIFIAFSKFYYVSSVLR